MGLKKWFVGAVAAPLVMVSCNNNDVDPVASQNCDVDTVAVGQAWLSLSREPLKDLSDVAAGVEAVAMPAGGVAEGLELDAN